MKTKIKRLEWPMGPTEKVAVIAGLDPCDMERRQAIAHAISQSPAIKELVEAARELSLHANEFHCGTLPGEKCSEYVTLLSTLEPFKEGG